MNTNSNNNTNNTNNARVELNAKKTVLELHKEISKAGVKLAYVTYNGDKIGISGEGQEAEAVLKKVSDEVSSPFELIATLNALTAIDDSGIDPDEEVEVEGVSCYISYKDKTLYRACDCEAVCDLNDLNCELPKEAIKTLLIERATR